METRSIGSLKVSAVGLGTNNFGARIDEKQAIDVVRACLDEGITFFDTADVYGATVSEQVLGRALGNRRDEAIIATKFGSKLDDDHVGAKPEYVRRAAEDSLRRLGTDRIDLYLLHRPDPSTPIADTLGALNELIDEGKVVEIGCSNFSVAELREAKAATPAGAKGFVNLQNEYSLLNREVESGILAECEQDGISFVPFYPLASGALTGKYHRNEELPEGSRLANNERSHDRFLTDQNFDIAEAVTVYAESHGHTLLEAAMSWLLHQPTIASVIAGASSPSQVKANAASISWSMTNEEAEKIGELASKDR